LGKTFANLPPMPKKTLFKMKDPNKLEMRRMGLENFLKVKLILFILIFLREL